jgi:DICT domain-containing protein
MPDHADDSPQVLTRTMHTELQTWRTAHPQATFQEIEAEVEARLARLRAHLLQETALASPATDWSSAPPAEQPRCPTCQTPLEPRGLHPRTLRSQHDQPVTLTRQYGTCPTCGGGFFPPR